MKLLENVYLALVLIAPVFMIANMVGGVMLAEKAGKFEWATLKEGLFKYIGILIMAGLIYIGTYLAEVGFTLALDYPIPLQDIAIAGIVAVGGKYAKGAFEKYIAITGMKINKNEEEETV